MATAGRYVECRAEDVPAGMIFTTPGPEQGQHIDRAYGAPGQRSEGSYGDAYMRLIDRSVGPVPRYYRWVAAASSEAR